MKEKENKKSSQTQTILNIFILEQTAKK